MTTEAMLTDLRARGVRVTVVAGAITLHAPLGEVTGEDLAALRDAKSALLAVLAAEEEWEREVAWRLTTMAPRVPARAPIPFLVVRDDVDFTPTSCQSCGGVLNGGLAHRCRPCIEAARRAVLAVREGVAV